MDVPLLPKYLPTYIDTDITLRVKITRRLRDDLHLLP